MLQVTLQLTIPVAALEADGHTVDSATEHFAILRDDIRSEMPARGNATMTAQVIEEDEDEEGEGE